MSNCSFTTDSTNLLPEIQNEDFILYQINTFCLAQYSYVIISKGEACIIDPMREPDIYLDILKNTNSKLKYIFETHLHADFISGHVELANLTSAQIVFGPGAKVEYKFHPGKDQEIFDLGEISIKLLHTPGHTFESSTYLLIDSKKNQKAIFTGDTLFLGEVGRPDLAVKGTEFTEKDMASMLYDSIHNKLKDLDENLLVFPGHGAGSPCGKKISAGKSDSLKNQKITNYVFDKNISKEDFIEAVSSNISKPQKFFFSNVMKNQTGYTSVEKILQNSFKPINLQEFEFLLKNKISEIIFLDSRNIDDFCNGFIPQTINITLFTNYATWAATLFPGVEKKIILISEPGKEKESITRLLRVGLENILGYLEGGFKTWEDAGYQLDKFSNLFSCSLYNEIIKENKIVIDVREKKECLDTGVIPNSKVIPLSNLIELLQDRKELEEKFNIFNNPQEDIFFICRSGYRSVTAASLFRFFGYQNNLINLNGGITKIKENELPLSIVENI